MKKTTIFIMLTVLGMLVTGTHAIAAGTTANTAVSNQATLDYRVSNVPQTQVSSDDPSVGGTSDPTIFRVDRKVDLTVTFIADQTVAPGETRAAMRYSVTNTSNDVLDFVLSAEDILGDGFAGAAISSTLVEGVVDEGDNVYVDADDNATFIDNLAADTTVYVWVVVNVPAGATDSLIDTWALQAQATDDGSVGSPTILTNSVTNTISNEDTVLADAAGTYTGDGIQDAAHSANSNFVVSTTTLTVSKTTAVIDDGINSDGVGGTGDDAVEYAVPGAVMEYTITMTNAGSIDATALTFNDDLSVEIGAGTIAWITDSITLNLNGGGATGLSDATDVDAGEFQGNNVEVTIVTLPAGEDAVIKFRVTITP